MASILSTSTCNYNTDKEVLTGNLRRNTKTFTGGCTLPKVAQNKKWDAWSLYLCPASVTKKKKKDDYRVIFKKIEKLLNRQTYLTHKTWLWVSQVPYMKYGQRKIALWFFFTII